MVIGCWCFSRCSISMWWWWGLWPGRCQAPLMLLSPWLLLARREATQSADLEHPVRGCLLCPAVIGAENNRRHRHRHRRPQDHRLQVPHWRRKIDSLIHWLGRILHLYQHSIGYVRRQCNWHRRQGLKLHELSRNCSENYGSEGRDSGTTLSILKLLKASFIDLGIIRCNIKVN